MKRITKIDGNYFLYFLIFACFLLVGILSFKDYGVSIDEHFHYSNGAHYYNFLKGLFFKLVFGVVFKSALGGLWAGFWVDFKGSGTDLGGFWLGFGRKFREFWLVLGYCGLHWVIGTF